MKVKIVSIIMMLMITVGSLNAVGIVVNKKDFENNPIMSSERSDMKALIVGVSDYEPAGPGGPDLNYCDDDADDMKTVLLDGGWSQSDITVLKNSQATESNIKSNLNNIATGTTSNSISLFFFSGHGKEIGGNEAVCPHDIISNSLYDYELNDILDDFNGKVICIIDSCHSGGMGPDGGNETVNVTLFIEKFIETLAAGNENRVILMACAADEYSFEDPNLKNGVFTYFVVEGLEGAADSNSDGKITAEETFDYAEPRTVSHTPQQHPQIYDGEPSAHIPILGGSGGSSSFEIIKYGDEIQSISGDWTYYGDHGIRLCQGLWAGDATVWYVFYIGDEKVEEGMEIGIEFCDLGVIGDGPDLYAYDFDADEWVRLKKDCGSQDNLIWKWYETTNSERFVDSSGHSGKISVKLWCEDDDDTIIDEVGVKGEIIPPDLDCSGSINGNTVKPGQRITGSFTVKNVGEPGTRLDWAIIDYPDWGYGWSSNPYIGENLEPGAGTTVTVTFSAPLDEESYSGYIVVVNENDDSDKDSVEVSVVVKNGRSKSMIYDVLAKLKDSFPVLFTLINN